MRLPALLILPLLSCTGSEKGSGETGEEGGDTAPLEVDGDSDSYTVSQGDCDDANATVNPGAPEICDELDNNCDGAVDEGAADWYPDGDGDGYGDAGAAPTASCDPVEGSVADNTDCDDADPAYHPGAEEEDCADPNDYNCDGSTGYADEDSDGFAACEECDDANAAIHPGAEELCNGVDDDCDGGADSPDEVDYAEYYQDADGDGYGYSPTGVEACAQPKGYVAIGGDCDDADSAINPAEPEICDALDNDCDGGADEGLLSAWYKDSDGDGYGDPATGVKACSAPAGYVADGADCDDGDAAVNPAEPEICDSVDQDCDGVVDDGVAGSWYLDADGDSYGDPATKVEACEQPEGYIADGTDCDDTDPSIGTGAPVSSSQTFSYTGAEQTFTVPDCVTEITITAYGASGKKATTTGSLAGLGGMAEGVLEVYPGETLYVYVGGNNGYNGGGSSWAGSAQVCNGGGASDVRYGGNALSNRVIVAGGGGGVSGESPWGDGGDGGGGACGANYCGGEGGDGYLSTPAGDGASSGGAGVTGTHGGAGGGGGYSSGGGGAVTNGYGLYAAGSGALGAGGAGVSSPTGCCGPYGAAGGGGGYYGGGGVAGGCCGGGGAGGGSSWTGDLADPVFAGGVRSGDGQVVISW